MGNINKSLYRRVIKHYPWLRRKSSRIGVLFGASVLVIAELITMVQPYFVPHTYALGGAGQLLTPVNQVMANEIHFNNSQQSFDFNSSTQGQTTGMASSTSQQMSASAYADPSKGISVTDTVNKVDFSMTPKFDLQAGHQDGNRIVYPLSTGDGWVVYTMHGIGVKEDVLLSNSASSTMQLKYTLGLGNSLAAHVQSDGSIGIYGNTMFSGNIATSTAKDAALLQKARQNATKDRLLFTIPKPTIVTADKKASPVKVAYSLSGSDLSVNVSGLNKAHYPLSIDPSIYVVTAQQFMEGNNETNIDFDVADKLIEKGKTTGARFDTWTANSLSLNQTTWRQGVAVAGGYIYTAGGTHPNGGTATFSTVGFNSWTVPTGITSITVKAWGAGGGGGGGGRNTANVGGAGGGGGFAQSTITVTPGESLNVNVGGGGSGGNGSIHSGQGGGGGGYSDVQRSSTELVVAAGGAGGGGGGNTTSGSIAGGHAGAGGGTTGITGSSTGSAGGGGGGSQTSGGTAGSGGNNAGSAGSFLLGGDGGDGRSGAGSNGGASNGGTDGGGNGGNNDLTHYYGGGGGGSGGYYGGGGGSGSQSGGGGGGGGGGSSYTSGISNTNTAGSGQTPGNSTDPNIGSAGNGGNGGAHRANGNAGTSGLVIVSYTGSTTNISSVDWAQFNTSDGTIQSTNPGNGTCSGWCTQTSYDLPAGRAALSLVAYNGFLFAIGGEDSSCTTGNGTGDGGVCKTVYTAKLGANGEPQLWSPTSTDRSTWTYWYRDSDLTSPRSYTTAVAYNNRMYLLGGKTSSGGTPSITNTAQIADITANGKLGSWSTSATLPYNVYGHAAEAYNDRIYIIGGASSIGGAPLSSVYYNKVNSDGTLNSWIQTTSLTGGRMTNGSSFATVWGAYIYVNGGCSAVNGSGYCTSVASDTQLASINADGSLDNWNTDQAVSDSRMGQSVVAWRSYIYELGGCSSQDGSTGECTGALDTIKFGTINQDGDASTVNQSSPSGTAPCSGGSPYSCDLPSSIGNVLNETAIINGYLYVMGGCTNNACSSVSTGVSYQSIASDGSLQRPATCTGTYTDSYCVSSSSLPVGLGAAATTVFNGRIYLVGGFNTGTRIYYVAVNGDGSLGSWSNSTLSSITSPSISTLTYSYAYSRANPSSASTDPGNLYILGGCTDGSVGCSGYSQAVYKCNISTSGVPSGCSTSGQLQIGAIPGGCGTGLGAMVGTVYANYIYLVGGLTPGCVDLTTARYAKIDSSNNIVTVGSGWVEGANQTATGRRRGAGFGYNGYLYVIGGYDGTSGVLDDIEFAKINVSDGSWGPFSVSSVTINQRWGLSVPISNSYAYVVGGCTVGAAPSSCTSRTNTTQTFQIYNNDSGAPANYSTAANTYATNPNRVGVSSAILNGYIYAAGGCTSTTDCTTAVNTVSYAPIDVNGNVGAWSDTTATLPAVRTWGKLEAAGGTLYYIGGQSSTATDERAEVYYGTPASGNITTWGTASNGLPAARTKFGAAVWNNRLYVVGGLDGTASPTSTVYVSPQLNSGGNITSAWSTGSTSFNVARSGLSVVAYANNLYVFGGSTGADFLSDSQYSQISTSTGNAGSWTYSTSLPSPISDSSAFAVNGYIYLVGGRTAATTCTPVTLVAPVSANTTISSGNNPTGVGDWYQTNAEYSGDRYGDAAVYNDGKAYVLGGGCGSTLTYASPVVQQTALLTQPQVAKYSIAMDTDSDVYPNAWLLNGVDNSIGARWQLKYRSMTNNAATLCTSPAMTTWGQETNFGNVTLGTPGVYTPLNGSGVNTNCARYYYFSVTVDSSQAFGYPDDYTRGPTITDLTLQFTADPSKRLMHGRTFTGGLQQPDDTPYYTH